MKRTLFAAGVLAIVTVACGGGKDSPAINAPKGTAPTTEASMGGTMGTMQGATRTVDINMVDIGYQPATFSAQVGERVEFVFHNQGQVPHDAFIGDAAAQSEHETEMRQGGQGSGSGGHAMGGDRNGITVDPGKTGRLTYTFDRTGTVEIGCHQPGHYAAGMKVAVTVA